MSFLECNGGMLFHVFPGSYFLLVTQPLTFVLVCVIIIEIMIIQIIFWGRRHFVDG